MRMHRAEALNVSEQSLGRLLRGGGVLLGALCSRSPGGPSTRPRCQLPGPALAAASPSDRVGAWAYEFWTTLAEEEVVRVQKQLSYKGYIESYKA